MKLSTLLDTDKLAKHIADGVVNERRHPTLPLTIYNYSTLCTFDGPWNEITTLTRGLIVDDSGEVLARGFRKFMNASDERYPETLPENWPSSTPEFTEKLDGSLILIAHYGSQREPVLATRGSFTSEQAVWATQWYSTHQRGTVLPEWPIGYTPVMEVLAKFNRIVVDYDHEGLVLLALINIETGAEICRADLEYWGKRNRIPVVKVYDITAAQALEDNRPNFEGFVVTWRRSGQEPFRCKIKTTRYRALHKILTGVSPIGIWELLKDGKSAVEALCKDDVPKSFADWVQMWENDLKQEWYKLSIHVEGSYAQMLMENTQPGATRKDYALWIKGNHPELAEYLFARLDGRDYSPMIWKSLRPQGDVFKRDEA